MGNAVTENGNRHALRLLFDYEVRGIRPDTYRIAGFVNSAYPPVVIAGIGAGVFIITGSSGIDHIAPGGIGSRHIVIFGCRWMNHQFNFIALNIVQGNPLVDRVNGHLKIGHLVEFIQQRMIGLGKIRVNV